MATSLSTSCTLLIAVFALSLFCSSSLEVKKESSEPSIPVASPKVLKLERQSVVLPKTDVHGAHRKNFYSAKINVGTPAQEFHVAFDLGGGTMVLPSSTCTSKACLERHRYDKWESSTAEDINANGQLVQPKVRKTLLKRRDHGSLEARSYDMGTGKVSGDFVREQVCVAGFGESDETQPRCFPLAMLVANKMSDKPFGLEPYDGTVGLGLAGMSVSMEFNFLAAFHFGYAGSGIFSNSFGLHISGEDGGELTLGGYDVKRLTHPLKWAPVAEPDEGRWQVSILGIRVGNNTLDVCKDRACRAAIDYSASLLGVPPKLAPGLEKVLSFESSPIGFGDGCNQLAVPDIHLQLENDVTLTLPSEDFISDFGLKKTAASCTPRLTHHNADEALGQDYFILGESALRRYYTFFNADTKSVGFSLAAGGKKLALPGAKKGLEEDGENPVIVLVQVQWRKSKTRSSLGM